MGIADDFVNGGYVSQHVALSRPNHRVGDSRWLGYCYISTPIKQQFLASGYGGTKIQLSLEDVKDIVTPFPPINEQTDIAKYIDTNMKNFDGLISRCECAIKLLKERRTALISSAVTGKIDVRNA